MRKTYSTYPKWRELPFPYTAIIQGKMTQEAQEQYEVELRAIAKRGEPIPVEKKGEHLIGWLDEYLTGRERILALGQTGNNSTPKKNGSEGGSGQKPRTLNNFMAISDLEVSNKEVKCCFCDGDHYPNKCKKMESMTSSARRDKAMKARVCLNCLKPGHYAPKCLSTGRCMKRGCGKNHHTLLHRDNYRNQRWTPKPSEPEKSRQ